ncbi:glyoxal reductase [Rozella allomycis CSF55]|uniref:Glyoxal reductase n=1 Tax=Rozella allomycis (strain CSF55) TaxID=988480 RepID=A0A4P9YL00_ROZAC|nr:glyoxal reductase [Rozella allomycis CSF55]
MKNSEMSFTLSNGNKIPKIGRNHILPFIIVGTYRLISEDVERVVSEAINIGYRHIDTATVYRNEEAIGNTLKSLFDKGVLRREEIFITSKLAPKDQGYEKATKAVDESLKKLGLDYIDLYLIHWPGTSSIKPNSPKNKKNRQDSWKALEEAYRQGKLKAIGVSNYTINHLKEMEEYATIKPMVLQCEAHPLYIPIDEVKYCKDNSIIFEAYTSLGEGKFLQNDFLEEHQFIQEIADRHGKTVAQVLLAWALQQDWTVLPKSKNPSRLKENFDCLFALKESEMEQINELSRTEMQKICWDPIDVQ